MYNIKRCFIPIKRGFTASHQSPKFVNFCSSFRKFPLAAIGLCAFEIREIVGESFVTSALQQRVRVQKSNHFIQMVSFADELCFSFKFKSV